MKTVFAVFLVVITIIWAAPNNVRRKRATVESLPIPVNAQIPGPLTGKSYFSAQVVKDVYYVQKEGSLSLFIVTNCGVVVVDAPPSIGADMEMAIKEVTTKRVTHLIYTHSHGDHIGNANATLFKNAEIIAHEETTKVLKERKDPARPVPRTSFSGCSKNLNIGDKRIVLDYHGPIHTPGNIFIWLPVEKILYTADMVSPGSAPYTRLGVAEDIVAYMEAADQILTYQFKDFFGGHARIGNRKDVCNQVGYLQDVQKNALTAAATVDYGTVAATVKDQANGDLIDYLYNQEVAQKCADLTAAQWGTTLGYVDVYAKSHCDVLRIAQRIDFGTNKVIGNVVQKCKNI